jgi:hypothetical protein
MIGQISNSIDVVLDLLKSNPDIAALGFRTYELKPARRPVEQLEELQDSAFHHRHDPISLVPRSSLDRETILRMCAELGPRKCLALTSKVQVNSSAPTFIPMIDFICEKNEPNLRLLASQLAHLHRIAGLTGGGFLLESDRSYHYQARLLLPWDSWIRFVGHVLLLHPPAEHREVALRTGASSVIDVRYTGHCLIDGESALRISPNSDGSFPKVVKQIAA